MTMSGLELRTGWTVRAARQLTLLALVAACAVAPCPGQSSAVGVDTSHAMPQGEAGKLRSTRLNMVISDSMLGTLSRNDAIAAVSTWAEFVGRQHGFAIQSSVRAVSNAQEARQFLERNEVDLLLLDVADYFQLEEQRLVLPFVLDLLSGASDPRSAYVILVHPDASVDNLGQMRQSRLLLYPKLHSATASAWLASELAAQSLGTTHQYFAAVQQVNRPQDCVLPVYFKRGDACLVDEHSFQLLGEMNAQLRQLRVVARSAPLLDRVTAIPTKPHPYHEDLVKAILELDRSTRGKQILTVFKSSGHVEADEKYLQTSREFWKRYRTVLNSQGKRGGS